MLHRDFIRDLPQKVGSTVVVRGWIFRRRTAGKLCFIEVRDGSGVVQAVVKKGSVGDAEFEAADKVQLESSVAVTGNVRADRRAPGG